MPTSSVVGPSVSDELWAKINTTAQSIRLRTTSDLFATEPNNRAERFCSHCREPGSEAVDELMVPDWVRSSCDDLYRKVVNAFLPGRLIKSTMPRAIADAALCVLLVPVSVMARY